MTVVKVPGPVHVGPRVGLDGDDRSLRFRTETGQTWKRRSEPDGRFGQQTSPAWARWLFPTVNSTQMLWGQTW